MICSVFGFSLLVSHWGVGFACYLFGCFGLSLFCCWYDWCVCALVVIGGFGNWYLFDLLLYVSFVFVVGLWCLGLQFTVDSFCYLADCCLLCWARVCLLDLLVVGGLWVVVWFVCFGLVLSSLATIVCICVCFVGFNLILGVWFWCLLFDLAGLCEYCWYYRLVFAGCMHKLVCLLVVDCLLVVYFWLFSCFMFGFEGVTCCLRFLVHELVGFFDLLAWIWGLFVEGFVFRFRLVLVFYVFVFWVLRITCYSGWFRGLI